MVPQNTYQNQAQVTKSRRQAQYAKQREQAKAMQAYSDAMRAWRLGSKVEADKPQMKDFWKW